jgi:hypothetical protein
MKTAIIGMLCFGLALVFAYTARAQSTNADFQQAVADYQKSHSSADAEKVIKMAAAMDRLPPIPEEARKHFVMGQTIFKSAKNTNDFSMAGQEFSQAVREAPWWPEARYNRALAQEAAGHYTNAIISLKLYQLFKLPEAEARAVQDKIYILEAKQEMAAKDKELAAQKAAEESSPEVVAERKKNNDQDLIKRLNGSRYVGQSYWTKDLLHDNEFVIRVTTLVWGQRIAWAAPDVILDGTPVGVWLPPVQMQIVGREARYFIGGQLHVLSSIFTISEDGKSITEKRQTADGSTYTYDRQ